MSLIEGRWILVAAAASAAAAIPWMLLGGEQMPVHPPPRPTVTDFAPRDFGGLSYALAAPPFSPTRSAGTTAPQDIPPPEPAQAAAPPPAPPILVGIVSGGGRPGVALAKGADGRTETLATGANIGGWRLVRIGRDHAVIRRLDAGTSGKRRLYSYIVQNGRARDLATSLQLVLGTSEQAGAEEPQRRPPPRPAPAPVVPRGAEPDEAIAPQTPLPGSGTPLVGGVGAPGPRIVPNEENNSLLIYATGEEYEFIREALGKLDQPVAQVLIEATLAEVTLGNDLRYGVNFRALSGDALITNSSSGGGAPASIFPGFSLSVIGSSAQAVLNSLQSRTEVRVLSAPKLMVLNNQTATLQVGDQVPIVTQQAQSVAAPGAPIVNSIELRDTGVILKVTPRVNDSGTIILDIAQEVSDVSQTTSSGINSPTIQQRRIASTVATRSGQMIALGGLIRDRSARSKSGIPLLSQIPVVGGLFGTQGDNGSRTELIILLTPTVIRAPGEMDAVVGALIDGLERARPIVERARERQVGGQPPRQ